MVGRYGGDSLSDAEADDDVDGIVPLRTPRVTLFRRSAVRAGRARANASSHGSGGYSSKAVLRVARVGKVMQTKGTSDVFIRQK